MLEGLSVLFGVGLGGGDGGVLIRTVCQYL